MLHRGSCAGSYLRLTSPTDVLVRFLQFLVGTVPEEFPVATP